MKVKVPQKIKVLYHPYEIWIGEHLKVDENYMGTCNTRSLKLIIERTLPESQRAYTLNHEILEAYNDALSMGLAHKDLDSVAIAWTDFQINVLGITYDWSDIKEL